MTAPRWADVALTRALHVAAVCALRVQSPLGARRTLWRLAAWLRPLGSLEEARAMGATLGGAGTCLSRALAVSARLPGSSVAIGVDVRRRADVWAHAWVQIGGRVVYPSDGPPQGETIAEL